MTNDQKPKTTLENTIFNETHYGKPISEELARLVASNTSRDDQREAALAVGLSISTVQHLILRYNALTVKNQMSIVWLVRRAIENCKGVIRTAETDLVSLEALIDQEEPAQV